MVNQQIATSIAERLAERVEEAIQRATDLNHPVLVSVSEDIEPVDPLRLFANSSHYASERWYWEHPEGNMAIAGAGVASNNMFPASVRFDEADRLHREISSTAIIDPPAAPGHPGPIFFTAFSFDPERKPDRRIWRGFPPVYLYVPRVMLLRQGDRHTLTFNLTVSTRREIETILKSLTNLQDRTWKALEKEIQQTRPQVDTEPSADDDRISNEFREGVVHASQAVRDGTFEKVVLARYRDIYTSNYFDVPAALDRMRTDYPGCYTFAVAKHGSIFLGASPEQLVRQDGKEVSAASLAGSIRRGTTLEEDEAFAEQLLASRKDQHEHEICARAIEEALGPLCAELDAPEVPELLSFSNVHHLYTPIRGTLRNGSSLIQLVARLHPTPAVGGYPRDVSQEFLRENEGFDRGWYASPLGWMDTSGNGEFIVTLRSAIISGQRARLFAGCGIVGDSDPVQELAESNVKMRPMLSALGGDGQ